VADDDGSAEGNALDDLARSWSEVLGQFAVEAGRPATNAELAEVLTWAVRSAAGDDLDDLPAGALVVAPGRSRALSVVPELNDAVFVLATALVSNAVAVLRGVVERPSTQSLLDLLGDAVTRAPEGADVGGPGGWTLRRGGRPKVRVTVGDVIAVPMEPGRYRYVVVVARNRFGTALGARAGSGPLRPPARPRRAASRPRYVGTESIEDGTWPVVGHDEEALAGFDPDPEIFHVPRPGGHARIGPYGAAERAGGALRDLTQEEAREVGVLEPGYAVALLTDEFEEELRRLVS
jgi:hypothetical protein